MSCILEGARWRIAAHPARQPDWAAICSSILRCSITSSARYVASSGKPGTPAPLGAASVPELEGGLISSLLGTEGGRLSSGADFRAVIKLLLRVGYGLAPIANSKSARLGTAAAFPRFFFEQHGMSSHRFMIFAIGDAIGLFSVAQYSSLNVVISLKSCRSRSKTVLELLPGNLTLLVFRSFNNEPLKSAMMRGLLLTPDLFAKPFLDSASLSLLVCILIIAPQHIKLQSRLSAGLYHFEQCQSSWWLH
ncbi:hypothetical protein KC367_g170 [Hortaea werneckii]|nr:hypothetical protein KC367_g170 [Hortaea werneckii]